MRVRLQSEPWRLGTLHVDPESDGHPTGYVVWDAPWSNAATWDAVPTSNAYRAAACWWVRPEWEPMQMLALEVVDV